jgi:putative colanic acid biosynthesis acetyltransferase WcaF
MREIDPYRQPSFSFGNRVLRFLWGMVYLCLFRPTPRPLHAWRAFLLRLFGAKLGTNVRVYSTARIWAPWNLICEDVSSIADDAIIYNPKLIRLGTHTVVSQHAYICGATHDYEDPGFPLIAYEMRLGAYAWICARASVQPGVQVGEGAVLALGSVATRDLEPWTVYGGVPARRIKSRQMQGSVETGSCGAVLAARESGSGSITKPVLEKAEK